MPIKFISEVSSNHSCNIERSLRFIDISSEIGCDAVKFQLFKIDKLFSREVLEISKNHRDRKKWELPLEFIPELYNRCQEKNIEFSCTPFYIEAVDMLEPYVDFYKIASYELLWDDLLIACAKTKKPIIISTGMATMEEISHAVDILRVNGSEPVLLHCNSAYPSPVIDSNLSAIKTIRDKFACSVGWSDHSVHPGVIHRAIHKWDASTIEFHLDLDGSGEEFVSGHCWLPQEIKKLIQEVRDAEKSDGNGVKKPSKSELSDRLWRTDPEDGLRPLKPIRSQIKKYL